MMAYSFSWSENLTHFAKSHCVFAPDLLNMGFSDRAPTDASLGGHVAEIIAFMDAARIARASFVGSSQSGSVALLLAARHPERVDRIIAADPAVPETERNRAMIWLFHSSLGRTFAPLLRYGPRLGMWLALAHLYCRPSRILRGTASGYLKAFRIPGTIAHLLRMVSTWKQDFAELAREIPLVKARVLLVWGGCDRVVPLAAGRRLTEQLPHADLVVIPGAGHLPYEEYPEEFNRIVSEWLAAAETAD